MSENEIQDNTVAETPAEPMADPAEANVCDSCQ